MCRNCSLCAVSRRAGAFAFSVFSCCCYLFGLKPENVKRFGPENSFVFSCAQSVCVYMCVCERGQFACAFTTVSFSLKQRLFLGGIAIILCGAYFFFRVY
jgi:hypothetical protein